MRSAQVSTALRQRLGGRHERIAAVGATTTKPSASATSERPLISLCTEPFAERRADLPGVVIVIRLGGQLQVALRSGVVEAHAAVAEALRDAGWVPERQG